MNTYLYVGGNPVSFKDPRGLTQYDVDVAWTLIRETQRDLNFPPNAPMFRDYGDTGLPPGWSVAGQHNPNDPNTPISISSQYRRELGPAEARSLLDTLIHELLHRTLPPSHWSLPDQGHGFIVPESLMRRHLLEDEFNRRRGLAPRCM